MTKPKGKTPAKQSTPDATLAMLKEAELQIVYLHERWRPTGSGNAVLARIRALLAKAEGR